MPTYSLTAGADARQSLVGLRLEESGWGRIDVEGKIQGKIKIWHCNVFQNLRRQAVHALPWTTPTHIFSLALFLIGFTVQNAEVCFAFFSSEVQNSNFESNGVLGSCSVFFQDSNWALKSLICQLIFIGSQFKKKIKFSYSIGTTSNFQMTFLMYFLLNTM